MVVVTGRLIVLYIRRSCALLPPCFGSYTIIRLSVLSLLLRSHIVQCPLYHLFKMYLITVSFIVKKSLKDRLGGFAKEDPDREQENKKTVESNIEEDEELSLSEEDNGIMRGGSNPSKRKVYLENSPPRELKRGHKPVSATDSDDDVIPVKRNQRLGQRGDHSSIEERQSAMSRTSSSRTHLWSTRTEGADTRGRRERSAGRSYPDTTTRHRGRDSEPKSAASAASNRHSYSHGKCRC